MAITITDRFAEQCSVVFSNNYDTCGTLTRSSIEYMTPTQLEALFAPGGLFADLDAWFRTSLELKACGTPTYGMYDWIMSGADRTMGRSLISIQKSQKNPSLLFPFILATQDSVINTDFWAITTGYANSAYTAVTTGPLSVAQKALGAAGDRVIRVVSRYGVEMDAAWFVDRDRIHVFGRSATGVTQDGQWKVLASAAEAAGAYVDVLVTSENAGSSAPYNTAPTSGVVLLGVNNVNDYESWCHNRPNYDGRKEVPFWWQTMRRTRCVDQMYKEYFARLMSAGVNEAFKRFGDMEISKRNAQDELNWQKRWVHAFFFNKPLSASQTLALWKNLETINTPTTFGRDPATTFGIDTGMGAQPIAKRANFFGVMEQLRRCDRVRDLQNNPLNFYEFLAENYRIKRAREGKGKVVSQIDWYTNSIMSANFVTAYTAYLKVEFGADNVQFPIKLGENLDLGMVWRSFTVKWPAGLTINIISNNFFDDYLNAHQTESSDSAGNLLLCLDLGRGGSIFWSQLGSNRKEHTVGDLKDLAPLDSDWGCVMESITKQITLTSETGTAVVSCPLENLAVVGMAVAPPVTTGVSGSTLAQYSNLY